MSALEPAASIVRQLGGFSVVAKLCNLHFTQVWRWTQPRSKKGTGGTIPQRHHLLLLAVAKKAGVPLTAADFLPLPEPTAKKKPAAQKTKPPTARAGATRATA
jgi:hypothetical protein